MTRIHCVASRIHYAHHLAPVWDALPEAVRGVAATIPPLTLPGWRKVSHPRLLPDGPALVASWRDLNAVRGRRAVYMEHGAGQTYTPRPNYAGHPTRPGVGLFLCPSQRVAGLNRRHHSAARIAVVGCPKLDRWHANPDTVGNPDGPVVVAFHWAASGTVAEATSAWKQWKGWLPDVLSGLPWPLVLHAHPRAQPEIALWAARAGVEFWPDLDRVYAEARCVVVDNSSVLYEAASIGLPVVAVNAPNWRRDVTWGLRFWEHIPGPQIVRPSELAAAVDRVCWQEPGRWAQVRERVSDAVYARRDGTAAAAAADAVVGWMADGCPTPETDMADGGNPYAPKRRYPAGDPRNTTRAAAPAPTVRGVAAVQVDVEQLDPPDGAYDRAAWVTDDDVDADTRQLRARAAAIDEMGRDSVRKTVRDAVDEVLGDGGWDWDDE